MGSPRSNRGGLILEVLVLGPVRRRERETALRAMGRDLARAGALAAADWEWIWVEPMPKWMRCMWKGWVGQARAHLSW